VRNNPLRYVDPSGLILFAFDGTANSPDSRTNVHHFARAYDDFSDYDLSQGYDGSSFYVAGVGTQDQWLPRVIDGAIASSMITRIEGQMERFEQYVQGAWDWHVDRAQGRNPGRLRIALDVVGFSRGAASAREFSNRVADLRRSPRYQEWQCLSIQQRLLALFDTVLSTNTASVGNRPVRLEIPPEVDHVFHAVAMNEHRSLFNVESIAATEADFHSNQSNQRNQSRVERGFVGAHANVGGGYNTTRRGGAPNQSDLSDLALMWMVQMASQAGVQLSELPVELRVVTRPVVMDERRGLGWTAAGQRGGSRQVNFPSERATPAPRDPALGNDPETQAGRSYDPTVSRPQAELTFAGGMNEAVANRYIQRRDMPWYRPTDTAVGDVHLCAYLHFLRTSYGMVIDLALHGCPAQP
jgi:Uncharacterized alpha/beta hydrolase domain (DUF2235)